MNVYEITAKTLERELNESVPDIYVVMAKHQVMGLGAEQIAEVLSCDLADVQEAETEELYKRVKGLIASAYAQQTANQSTGWDALEQSAIEGLMKRVPLSHDADFLLKVAAVANRATRKHQDVSSRVLDPGLRAGRTTITLTERLVKKMTASGDTELEKSRQLSIGDGSMSNPSFTEIDALLSVRPTLARAMEIRTQMATPTQDELLEDFMRQK